MKCAIRAALTCLLLAAGISVAQAVDIQADMGNLTTAQQAIITQGITTWEGHLNANSGTDWTVSIEFSFSDLGATLREEEPGTDYYLLADTRDGTRVVLGRAGNYTYDSENRPTGATITFNSNSVITWYEGTGTPVPSGEIDLLSITYHELCHTLGFTSACRRWVDQLTDDPGSGTRIYNEGGTPTATIEAAPSNHTAPVSHPNDLMNPSIGAGRRRLPSALNVAILNHSVWNRTACMAYILDRSGSMGGTPLANAKTAAKQGITSMRQLDEVAVVSFSSGSRVDFDREVIADDDVRQEARDAVDGLNSGGMTSIGAGLLEGYNQLESSTASRRDYLLLSDGEENTEPWAADVLPLFLNLGIPRDETTTHRIHAIAYGPGAQQVLLAELAGATGGVFLFAPYTNDPLALADLFFTIQSDVYDEQRVVSVAETIAAPDVHLHDFTISDDMSEITTSLLWENVGDDLMLALQTPDGDWITPSNWGSYFGVELVEGPGIQYYTCGTPLVGDWQARVTALSGATDYAFVVTAQSSVQMDLAFDHDVYPNGTPITLTATLTEGDMPVLGATVTASVQVPTSAAESYAGSGAGSEEPCGLDLYPSEDGMTLVDDEGNAYYTRIDMPMFDDGAHGDGAAGDGVYGGIFTDTYVAGSYSFSVIATGQTSSGISFTREGSRSTVVDPDYTLTYDLVVQSQQPDSGVEIFVSPADHYGQDGGTTEFSRIYEESTVVTLVRCQLYPDSMAP